MGMVITLSIYFDKYLKLYMSEGNRDKSGEQVYELLEKWYISRTGERKCKNYSSFKSLKSQYYRALRG